MTQLELRQIFHTYREGGRTVPALEDINLTLASGEFVSLIGASGSGKSTLLKIVAGLIPPDSGMISFDGQVVRRPLGKAAYMPQSDALLPWRTILSNVVIGGEIHGVRSQTKKRARELLPLFGLEGFENVFPAQLSGGMRQRAAFLRTFLSGQDILLLDEPFGALDALTRRDLQIWLLNVWQHFSYTVLFVTHDIEEALFLSDRVLVLSPRPGRIIHEIHVPFARPRHETVMPYSSDFIRLEQQLFQALQK